MTRAKRRPRSTARTPDGRPTCYQLGCDRAAGHGRALAFSAFCSIHQPHRPEVPGAGWKCPVCSVVWSRQRDFDDHQQIDYDRPRAVRCLAPAELDADLVRDPTGTWVTPEGLRKRSAASARLRQGGQDA